MKKIIVRMRGGLGNQLFIISYALYLQMNSNDVELICDLSEYETYKTRKFELSQMKVISRFTVMNSIETKRMHKYKIFMKILHLRIFILNKINIYINCSKWIENLTGVIYGTKQNSVTNFRYKKIYMYGYFVDVKPILEIRDKLITLLSLNNEENIQEYTKIIENSKHNIAISIRLGDDYVNCGWPICSKDYYDRALSKLKKDGSKIFIFSDDIKKAKTMFFGKEYHIVENTSPCEQIVLMSLCDDFIISNSTFSWWGAFLGKNNNRKIYAPEFWHTRKTIDSMFFFENMILIPN
ncbi:alpha-1,2-fucosyltransferase [Thomasclavelia sp.]|uniref:alpha-1,2-fucosyltransferase n=1 Tax=Thomasclavelia sp. TaxID=3025757 RepID=UPI0025E9F08E|nr:alpha-1,2-fucosyltransferase [Thomasclavelia sp.]